MKATVFLGGGRITSALVAGLRLAKYKPPLVVYDRHPEKLRRLKREFNVSTEHDLARAVSQACLLIVAVRPQDVANLLDDTANCDWAAGPRLVVSLAAGIPLQKLRSKGSSAARWGCVTSSGTSAPCWKFRKLISTLSLPHSRRVMAIMPWQRWPARHKPPDLIARPRSPPPRMRLLEEFFTGRRVARRSMNCCAKPPHREERRPRPWPL